MGNKAESSSRATSGTKLETGDIWKAKQLKEFCRANGLCYRCGDKYTAGHTCATPTTIESQAHANQIQEIIPDDVLDAICSVDLTEDPDMHLSLNAIFSTDNPEVIQLRVLVGNKTLLMLLDSGSSHSYLNKDVIEYIRCTTTPISTRVVKVANGSTEECSAEV